MKIAINTLAIIPGKVGGTEIFLVNLIKNLVRIDKENRYLILVTKNNKRIFSNYPENVELLEFNFNNNSRVIRIFFEQVILPSKLKKEKVGLFIAPNNTGLIYCPCKILLIVHDLIYFIYPKYYSFLRRNYLQKFVKYSCKKANKIVAVSQSTKNDIVRYTGVKESKIKLIYEGVELKRFANIKKEEAKQFIIKEYGIKDYIFSPTSLYPHKNNHILIRAFAELKKQKKIPHKLIITGGDPFKRAGWLKDLIRNYNLENEVFYLGRIFDKHIPLFYRAADLTVYLSSYEGFGLPVLEAMASGCPVLSSNRGSLPEIVGEAGIVVDPTNIEQITHRMYELLTNKTLRKEYVIKGLIRAKQFSWKNCANEFIKLYKTI